MSTLFWFAALWIAYVYGAYPTALAALAWVRRKRPVTPAGRWPPVSVLIAARNEEKDIGWKIRETLAWDYPPDKLRVLVGSDASEDATDDIVRSAAGSRVSLVQTATRVGKNRILSSLASQTDSDVLFFTDANSHIDKSALRLMMRHFADDRVGCVTGHSMPLEEAHGSADGARAYCGMEALLSRLESRLGSALVCDGAIFAIRRPLFVPLDPELANDLELPVRIGAAGYLVVQEPGAVAVERESCSPAQELARRRRICAHGLTALWRLRRLLHGLRLWQFLSHKFLRWLSLIPAALLLLSSGALAWRSSLFAAAFCVQLALWGAGVAGVAAALRGRPLGRPFSAVSYALLTATGALLGMYDACRGRKYDVWESPSLTRGAAPLGVAGS